MNVHHLRVRYSGVSRLLHTKIELGQAFPPLTNGKPTPIPKLESFNALWDTGASGTVITQKVVDALGLKPIGMVNTRHAQGESMAEVFLISLRFPQSIGYNSIRVTKGMLGDDLHALIGMDVICGGDFSITNHDGATELNFQHPSQGLTQLHAAQQRMVKVTATAPAKPAAAPTVPRVGRNDPCPCGSGKKYKKCHGF